MTNPLAQDLGGVVLLLEKATPGPWSYCGQSTGHACTCGLVWGSGDHSPAVAEFSLTDEEYEGHRPGQEEREANTELAVAAINFLRTHSAEIAGALAEVERLNAIINTPQANDFLRAVSTEAEHQRQRWGSEHDAGKAPADWFWLVGYLAGKALHAHAAGDTTKAEHHIITTAAALANWHLAMFGKTDMRPGIDGGSAMQQGGGGGE